MDRRRGFRGLAAALVAAAGLTACAAGERALSRTRRDPGRKIARSRVRSCSGIIITTFRRSRWIRS